MEAAATTWKRTGRFQLNLLGVAEFTIDGESVDFRTRKSLALLAYLAVDPGPHSREWLADLLWPNAEVVDARASLRTALIYLRQALGIQANSVIVASREMLGLRPGSIVLDIDALSEARRLVRHSTDARLRHQVEAAVKRCRGPFLAGMALPNAPDFEAWVESQRSYWSGVQTELLERLASLELEAGEAQAAQATLELLTSIRPDEELAWRRLIEVCLRADDRSGARRAWNGYRRTVAELKATPSPLMADLGERIVAAGAMIAPTPLGFDDLDLDGAPLVGRQREWARLQAAYRRSEAGRTEVIILQGGSGVGKTRLASEFVASMAMAGADVIHGRAFEHLDNLHYAAIVEGLRARLEEENAPDDLLSDLWLGELARLLPELRDRYPDLPASHEDSLGRSRMFEAVTRLVIALARRKPLVLFLDDVQWLESGTRDLLRYAVRRWTETRTPVLLILALATDQQPDGELERWLAGLRRETSTRLLELHPLQPRDVTQLVGILAGSEEEQSQSAGEFGEWLAERTGGRPLPVVQMLRGMVEEGALRLRPIENNRWAIELPNVDTIAQLAVAAVAVASVAFAQVA
jgi:DNA-binding SARP family transcriptional activator